MTTATSPQPQPQPLAIADARYLWGEVERLKSQVAHLQTAERLALDEQQRLKDYVASFVTQAQLEAALCTKMSQSGVASSIDRTRAELLDALEKKADMAVVQALQTKKLDISVYESSTWDLKKFRAALEQSVHDLFAQFAHQIEAQVSAKLSIEDFDRIFNPDTNGQKAAIESAAERIARMNNQLDALQEYVQADRQRQHKLADLNVSVLDLTRKHNASRNSIAQLFSAFENTKERVHAVEDDNARTHRGFEEIAARVSDFQAKLQTDMKRHQQAADALRTEVDALTRTSQQTTSTLAQIQQFTQNTLLKGVDARLKQMTDAMDRALEDTRAQQQKLQQQTAQQLSKVTERVGQTIDHQAELEVRVRHAESVVASVREDVAAVKGPLLTAARNLREENVAILEEIRRSQDESRDILIDYKGLLEKDTVAYTHPASARLPPSSSSSASRPASSTAAAVSRKHRQQQIHALATRIDEPRAQSSNNGSVGEQERAIPRPHTSHGRLGVSPATRIRARTATGNKSPYASPRTGTATAVQADASVSVAVPQRPQSEAGARPKKSLLYSIAAAAAPADGQETPHELFVFPPSDASTNETL